MPNTLLKMQDISNAPFLADGQNREKYIQELMKLDEIEEKSENQERDNDTNYNNKFHKNKR